MRRERTFANNRNRNHWVGNEVQLRCIYPPHPTSPGRYHGVRTNQEILVIFSWSSCTHTQTHTSSSRATTEKHSFLPPWKAHCSHTFVWFLPCSGPRRPLLLQSCRRDMEDRVPCTAQFPSRGFHRQGCTLQHLQQMGGYQAACWSHKKKSMVDSGSYSDAQWLGRLFTCSKISAGEEKEVTDTNVERGLWKTTR